MKKKTFYVLLGSVLGVGLGWVLVFQFHFSSPSHEVMVTPTLGGEERLEKSSPESSEVQGEKRVAMRSIGKTRKPSPSKGEGRKGSELKLWDYLSKNTFETVPALLKDLGFSFQEIEKIKENKEFFKKLDRLQKREFRKFNAIESEFGLKGVDVLVQLKSKEKIQSFEKKGLISLKDPHDPERFYQMILLNGKELKGSKVFIHIDKFPEMKRLRLSHINLVKTFTEKVRRLVKSFLGK